MTTKGPMVTPATRGALTLSADAAALASLLEDALRLRRSEATERNPLSSRSHVPLGEIWFLI